MYPADHLIRGLTVTESVEKTCWWNGPEFLQNSESEWPANKVCQVASEQNTREVKQKYKYVEGVNVNLIQSLSNLQCDDKHSSWRLNAK